MLDKFSTMHCDVTDHPTLAPLDFPSVHPYSPKFHPFPPFIDKDHLRSATHERPKARPYYLVSIHALLAECDGDCFQ